MKPETLIFDKVRTIIPIGGDKTIFYVSMTETSYEVFFYTFFDGKPIQCYELAEQGQIDENELDAVFEAVVCILKDSKLYMADKNNIATIIIDKVGVKLSLEYFEKNERMYRIKKEWEQVNLLCSV